MAPLHRQPGCVVSALLVPFLSLASPPWLGLDGVPPAWAVLWLLPWALVDGPVSGAVAGIALGLVLDALSLGGASQIPALLLLGWWWGRLGQRPPAIQRTLNLGLLAWIGSVTVGLSQLLQLLILEGWSFDPWMRSWGLQTLLCQTLVTALLAPMLVSMQLLLWRKRGTS